MNILNDPYDCLCCNQTFCKSCIINYIKANKKCPFSEFFEIKNENKANTNNTDLFDFASSENTNNQSTKKDMTFQMNGQDFFADFPSSQSSQKEEQKKGEDDLFAAFSQPQSNIKEEKKESKKENKAKLEDDLFSAFGQPQSNIKEEKKEIKDNKKNVEDDLFAAFSQPQSTIKQQKEDNKHNKYKQLNL